jgi:secreted trypsin-like serine protease
MGLKAALFFSALSLVQCCNQPFINQIINNLTTQRPTTTTTTTTTTAGGGGGTGTCQCGKANRQIRIVNGVTTEENEYPWQVGLASGNGRIPYCGGSIVSSKTIITAAHCTRNSAASSIYVVVGEHDLTKSDGEKYVRVCSKAEHPSYNSRTTDYDYAVLTLCEELNFAKDVAPVCMPTVSGQGTQYENKASVVSGWGTLSAGGSRPSKLQEVTVNTMSNSQCCASNTVYSCSSITSRMICAAAPSKDSCQGDSGGPLVVQENGSYKLAGIVSWGAGCAQSNAPGVYARVTNQLGWLNARIQGSRCA